MSNFELLITCKRCGEKCNNEEFYKINIEKCAVRINETRVYTKNFAITSQHVNSQDHAYCAACYKDIHDVMLYKYLKRPSSERRPPKDWPYITTTDHCESEDK